jgi:muconate cycloisomerase
VKPLNINLKIISIEAIPYDLPTIRPHKLAMATITEHTLVLVRIRDDEGREGLGEVAIIPHYGAETQRGACQVIDHVLAPNLLGKDPTSIEALTAQMDQLIKREQRLHNLFLVKIGHGDPLTDVARAVAIKRALGDHASIRVDVNQGWDEATATRAIAELEAGGIDAVEQPLPAANIEGMRRLAERFAIPIMADEPIETVEDAFAFARANAADAFSLKLCKHGGLTNTRKVAAVAEAAGLSLFGGTMLESGIGTAATVLNPSDPALGLPAIRTAIVQR